MPVYGNRVDLTRSGHLAWRDGVELPISFVACPRRLPEPAVFDCPESPVRMKTEEGTKTAQGTAAARVAKAFATDS